MKTFYQLAEAIKTQSRGLIKPSDDTIISLIAGLPRKNIVQFALYCAIDCQQFDDEDSSELIKSCNKAAQDCINKIKLWLKDNETNCRPAVDAAENAFYGAANNSAARVAVNAAKAAVCAAKAACVDTAFYYVAHHASSAADYAARSANNDPAKIAEYTQWAREMRENIITFDLRDEAMQLAKNFVATGNIDRADLNALADHLMENDNELIQEKDGRFIFALMPTITGNSHEEVYEKIANNRMARECIVQALS